MTRDDAIKEIDKLRNDIGAAYDDADQSPMWYALGMAIEAMTSRKRGKWITLRNGNVECSECYVEQPVFSNYCPWCGSKMEVKK